jgi:hypothetical protein
MTAAGRRSSPDRVRGEQGGRPSLAFSPVKSPSPVTATGLNTVTVGCGRGLNDYRRTKEELGLSLATSGGSLHGHQWASDMALDTAGKAATFEPFVTG